MAQQLPPDLYTVLDRDALLRSAQAVVAADPLGALVTVDAEGRPRVRTVEVRVPGDDMVLWIATRPNTRKLVQIREHPSVTVYFNDDEAGSYLSVMGTATVIKDETTLRQERWQTDARLGEFYPNFPADYVLIRIEPEWLEVIDPIATADEETWRPQALTFE